MIEIIGSRKSRDTDKAIRYFKERRIPYQFVEIERAELGTKVWKSIFSSVDDYESLIDKNGKIYKNGGYEYMEYDARELLIEHPELLVLPIIRKKEKAFVGWNEEKAGALI